MNIFLYVFIISSVLFVVLFVYLLCDTAKKRKAAQNEQTNKIITSPIEGVPYITVIFCKQYEGWVPYTGYECDIDTQMTVEFINCISNATNVLNNKEQQL